MRDIGKPPNLDLVPWILITAFDFMQVQIMQYLLGDTIGTLSTLSRYLNILTLSSTLIKTKVIIPTPILNLIKPNHDSNPTLINRPHLLFHTTYQYTPATIITLGRIQPLLFSSIGKNKRSNNYNIYLDDASLHVLHVTHFFKDSSIINIVLFNYLYQLYMTINYHR